MKLMRLIFLVFIGFVNADVGFGQDTAQVYTIGGGFDETGEKIIKSNNRQYLILGNTSTVSNGESDIYLLKLDTNLNVIWSKSYGTKYIDRGIDFIEDNDGNIIIIGFTNGWGYGLYDIYCLKLNSNGDIIWEKSYGTQNWDFGKSILQLQNGNYFLTASTINNNNLINASFFEITQNGTVVWDSIPFSTFENDANHTFLNAKNNLIVCGYKADNDSIKKDFLIYEIAQQSKEITWTNTVTRPYDQILNKGINFNDSSYYFVGYSTELGDDLKDYFIVKTDSLGKIEFNFRYYIYPEDDEELVDIIRNDNKVSLFGYTKSIGSRKGWKDFQLLEVNQDGQLIDGYNYGGNEDEDPSSFIKINKGFLLLGSTKSYGNGLTDIVLIQVNNQYSKGYFEVFEIQDTIGEIITRLNEFQTKQFNCPQIIISNSNLILSESNTQFKNINFNFFDLNGRLLNSGTINSGSILNINDLPNVFVLSLYNNDSKIYCNKLIIH